MGRGEGWWRVGGGSVEVVDGSGRECGDVIDGRLAAVRSRPCQTWTAEFCGVRVKL
jgi:hypothetical protein